MTTPSPPVDPPRTILVPSDLSERSEAAIAFAAMLARSWNAALVLTTNVNLPERAVLEEVARAESLEIEEAADAVLRRMAARLAPEVPVTCMATFAEFPADGILACIGEVEPDMVVIASHGRGGVKRWLLGSVAEKLARGTDVPVVIVPVRG